jgi:hypothetical protein
MPIPELDTTSVSWIAYYDTGLDSMNAELMAGSGSASEMTGYDDGSEIKYNGPTREYTIRGSDNGWVTAHMDRTENYNTDQGGPDGIDGVHDIVDWTNANSESSIKNNVLERAIYDCLQQLDKWDSITYSSSDVGLYNYQYKSGNVSLFSKQRGGTANKKYPTFQYTESTNFKAGAVASSAETNADYERFLVDSGVVGKGQTRLYRGNFTYGANRYGATSISNLNAGEKYRIEIDPDTRSDISVHAVVIWG